METRGKSAYVNMNVVWLMLVCLTVFVAGMALSHMADRQAMTTCALCEKGGSNVSVHRECLMRMANQVASNEAVGLGGYPAMGGVLKTDGSANGSDVGVVLERDHRGPKPISTRQ